MKLQIIFIIIAIIICIYSFINTNKVNKHNKIINLFESKYIYIVLFIIVIFTSIYKLGDIPSLINIDEAGMGYDAYCLSKYGVDRWTTRFPLYLRNFSSGQSIMLAYLVSLFIKLFDLNIITIRLPMVLFRIFSFIACYFLSKKFDNKIHRFIFLLLLAISPYFIINSRFGLDCNLLLHFMAISICLFIYSLDSKHKNLMLLLSGICFGLTFYTYILSLIICSITIFLFIIYSLYIKKINIKNVIVFLIPIFIFIIPYILLYLVNTGVINEINGIVSIPKLYPFRSNEISLKNIVNNLYIFKSLLTYDKEEVLLYMSSCIKYGTLYYFSIPFVIIGFIYLIKDLYYIIKLKKFDIKFYIFSWLIAVIICMLIIENPNINKSNAIFIPLVYLCSLGIIKIIKNNYSIFYIIMILYITSFISFLNYLFYNYNYDNNSWFSSCDYSLALKYIDNNYSNRKYIHLELIDKNKAEYIYLALHYKLNPYENDVIPYNISDNDRYFIDDKIYDFNVKDIDTNQIYILRSQWLIDRIKNSNYIYKCKKIENYYVLIT